MEHWFQIGPVFMGVLNHHVIDMQWYGDLETVNETWYILSIFISHSESEPQSSFSKERSVLKKFPSQIFFLLGFTKHIKIRVFFKTLKHSLFVVLWKYLNKSICRVKYWNTVLTFENGGKSMGIGKQNIKLIFWNKLCRAVLIIF